MENKISFGNCIKHPNFPMMNCPICNIDKEVSALESRIGAGEVVLNQSKKQMRNLKKHTKELIRLKFNINENPTKWE